jgi:AraC-like DNA-binding protein
MASLSRPLPSGPRMFRATQVLFLNPADARTIGQWAKEVGTSKRTLGRLFALQTGMPFRTWRQQRRLLRTLELLGAGAQVTTIAMELGYDNTSLFTTMFRRCLGTTATDYLDARMPKMTELNR